MKRSLLAIALVSGFMFIAVSAFANPALLKKHDGYPTDGKGTTATGAAASLKGAEDAPKTLKQQNHDAGTSDTLKRGEARALPSPTGPGYVQGGVTNNHIKDATKVNATPK
ncbi:MAG: hypothetical protein Q7R68_06245 [Nitrospirales bacterium]|nr:hypothetical protein [Nitrospirales bacterium]